MERLELYQKIQLPDKAVAKLLEIYPEISPAILKKFSVLLCNPESYEKAEQELKSILFPDPDGMKILFVMLEST